MEFLILVLNLSLTITAKAIFARSASSFFRTIITWARIIPDNIKKNSENNVDSEFNKLLKFQSKLLTSQRLKIGDGKLYETTAYDMLEVSKLI